MGCSEGLLKFCDQWILIQINENEFLIKEGAGVRVAPYKTSHLNTSGHIVIGTEKGIDCNYILRYLHNRLQSILNITYDK